jgi:hypothetical protein
MSRGAGKVERGILSAVSNGMPWCTYDLADRILRSTSDSAQVSVRRALRKLAAQGRVSQVPSDLITKVWCQATVEKRRQSREQAKQRKRQEERAQREEDARRAAAFDRQTLPRAGDRGKLAKILAMLSSTHDGEVLAAARRAERLRKQMDMSWEGLLAL